jgi:hypothetical protein
VTLHELLDLERQPLADADRSSIMTTVPFTQLADSDLVVEAVYEGGTAGTVADDPLGKLLPCGYQGGFRIAGSRRDKALKLVVLYTSSADPDWPDALDRETGLFTKSRIICESSSLERPEARSKIASGNTTSRSQRRVPGTRAWSPRGEQSGDTASRVRTPAHLRPFGSCAKIVERDGYLFHKPQQS